MNHFYKKIIFSVLLITCSGLLHAQKTEIQYLSGKGCDQTVDWKFFLTEDRNSGKWTTIPVPSNWELQGFGKYNYGSDKDSLQGREKGLYKYEFAVPSNWKTKQVNIVFDGSMTDTEVKINGKSAGTIHQGSFYQFRYDISKLLKYGSKNLLEVTIAKHSANESVNKAERHGDFWIFGGIYRPVYLEAKPIQNIVYTAIDAKANGSVEADVFLNNISSADQLSAQVYTLQGEKVGSPFLTAVTKGAEKVHLSGKVNDIISWNPEFPSMYRIGFSLKANGEILHESSDRIGFRTVEIRERDGIYVNGTRIKFKGVNHHTFWPTTGRASCKKMSIDDVKLIKDMNMNAVRTSHYPPDSHFLEVCDSLGLFVLDELTGWHGHYNTEVGTKLVKEMVVRDVNHPSILLWDNGNEGGHNLDLDPLFGKFDIQNRKVVHPWMEFNGFATQHYRSYDYGTGTYWHGHEIVFPTEFLHGMYDGGSGAGLYDTWELMWNNPLAAGGFLWVFADEGIVRTDKNGIIDTDGSHAPDGIMGPFHEKEASYFAVKEIWSPVRFEEKDITPAFDGSMNIENRYFYTNLNQCSFYWKLSKMASPDGKTMKSEITGKCASPDVLPGQKGQLKLELPVNLSTFDVLYVTVVDQDNQELYTWSLPVSLPKDVVNKMMAKDSGTKNVIVTETDSVLIVKAGTIQFTIGKKDGLLKKVVNAKGAIPFNNGPFLCAGEAIFKSMIQKMDGDTLHLDCSFDEKNSRMKQFTWTFYPSGWAKLNIYNVPEKYDVDFEYMGVSFSYPENLVKGVKWLGNGPYRVWKNRSQGVELDVHQKDYNKTMTGVPPLVYPEFKGYHSNLYWAKIESKEQSFTVATSTEDIFLRLFTPDQPNPVFNRVAPPFPSGDISFMQAIPAIGTKSNDSWDMGPSGKKNMFFDYGPYDNWRQRSKIMTLFFNFSDNQ
ncbi:MAG: glycoside hydrolase family 2 [Bacteroidia bacterium]|nr:glycoside hydrolase family 2 [Bacteroidia bacterium]